VAVVGKLAHKETVIILCGEKQYTKQYKTQNTQSRKQNIQNKKTNIKRILKKIIQDDQKVSVHLMITIKSSGAQRLFDHHV
jgi:hypothetical protein